MTPREGHVRSRVVLSDQNGTYVYLDQVYGLHQADRGLHAADPSQVERLRRAFPDEIEKVAPKGTTHFLVVAGYDGHYWRLALRRTDGGAA